MLGTTRALVESGGYTAFTIDALVEASGISKTTVYRWWANRADVAIDMMQTAYGLPDVVTPCEASLTTVTRFLEAELRYHEGHAGQVLRGLFADSQHRPALAETLRVRYLDPRHQALQGLMESLVADGRIRPDVDVSLAATMLLSPLFQALLGVETAHRKEPPSELVDLLTRGLAP